MNRLKTRQNMIARFLIWNHLNSSAKLTGLLGHNGAHAVYGGFVVRGGFGFDKEFEEGGRVHRGGSLMVLEVLEV